MCALDLVSMKAGMRRKGIQNLEERETLMQLILPFTTPFFESFGKCEDG